MYVEVEADLSKGHGNRRRTWLLWRCVFVLELYFHFDMSYQGFPEVHQRFSENDTGVLFGFQHHKKNTFNGSGGESKNGAILSE